MSSSELPEFDTFAATAQSMGGDGAMNRDGVIAEMKRIAPMGQDTLDPEVTESLRVLTSKLLSITAPEAETEYQRFESIRNRGLDIDHGGLHDQLAGKTILVTGGTGCIGSVLLGELAEFEPSRIVSVSRGVTPPRRIEPKAEYAAVDIRDEDGLLDVFRDVKPDVVYHLAAQHDPGLAETAVAHTLTTNIFGTKNVIDAARRSDTRQIIYASTGKALRPFSSDTYASSKKVSEWLMSEATQKGDTLGSGVRFTHVVDNSIIDRRLRSWIASDSPIRLHGSEILFYMQSARESAHLLLNAGQEAEEDVFTLQAIRDLDWPVNLVDLALGAISTANTTTPIYFCGFESGYEEQSYPGLYDPMLAGEVSPLISALEAPQATPSATCSQVDKFPFAMEADDILVEKLQIVEQACDNNLSNDDLRRVQHELSWAMLAARLRSVPAEVLRRNGARMQKLSARQTMNSEHTRVNEAIFRAVDELRD